MKNLHLKLIDPIEHLEKVVELIKQLNPAMDVKSIESIQNEMVKIQHYSCFGLFSNDTLIGISSGWTTVRFYCGKQLELDNVIIDSNLQSNGYGKYFINMMKEWTLKNDYKSLSLNTYIQNSRSHKFYFNEGFKILGLHFEQKIFL